MRVICMETLVEPVKEASWILHTSTYISKHTPEGLACLKGGLAA